MMTTDERGFTLAEISVYMVVASFVFIAVYGLFISQTRQFRGHAATLEVRETLRGGVELLATELRSAGASRGDLQVIAPQLLKVRSVYAAGDVCVVNAPKDKYGIWAPQGTFEKSNDGDSALVYVDATGWTAVQLDSIWDDPVPAGVPDCDWPSTPRPGLAVEVTPIGAGNGETGSLLQLFRSVEYGLHSAGGRWWLGRKRWDETDYTLLAGPLRAPSDSGLQFRYFDAAGAETAVPSEVVRVEIQLRGESQDADDPKRGLLSTIIGLRN